MNETPDADAIALAQQLLHDAREGNAERLTAYLDSGVPVELTDAAGNTLLMLAAYHGHTPIVTALIERGANVDAINDRGQSPIAGALFKGDEEVVVLLLGADADLDIGTPSGWATAEMFDRMDLLGGA